MSEHPPTVTGEPLVYRPISGLALVGFVLACLFALILALTTVVALSRGEPLFLWTGILGLALGGAVLSLLGMWHIRSSEGTRAGMTLARWGLWLSGFLGLTYFAYYYVTGMAITKQANDFLMVAADDDSGFFPRLLKSGKEPSQLYHAFLLTLAPADRGDVKPTQEARLLKQHDQPSPDGNPGRVMNFRKTPVVVALSQLGDKSTVEPLGVQSWVYKDNSYEVVRTYRITTPEAIWEVPLTVRSTEGYEAGDPRRWMLVLTYLRPNKVTSLGQGLGFLRLAARRWLDRRQGELMGGMPLKDFNPEDTDWAKLLITPQQRRFVQEQVTDFFTRGIKGPTLLAMEYELIITPWSRTPDGKVQLTLPFRLKLPPTMEFPSGFNVEGEFDVVSVENADPLDLKGNYDDWVIRKTRVLFAAPLGLLGKK